MFFMARSKKRELSSVQKVLPSPGVYTAFQKCSYVKYNILVLGS